MKLPFLCTHWLLGLILHVLVISKKILFKLVNTSVTASCETLCGNKCPTLLRESVNAILL